MAVGDLVSEVQDVVATGSWTFQPAATVQVCITQFITDGHDSSTRMKGEGDIETGATTGENGYLEISSGTLTNYAIAMWSGNSHKFFINNSSYLTFNGNNAISIGISGIQTQ